MLNLTDAKEIDYKINNFKGQYEKLEKENAELKAKLESAILPKFKRKDEVYIITRFKPYEILSGEIKNIIIYNNPPYVRYRINVGIQNTYTGLLSKTEKEIFEQTQKKKRTCILLLQC